MTTEALHSILERTAERTPDAPFVHHLAEGRTLSYAETLLVTRRLVQFLSRAGVGKKDKVAFVVRNHWLVFPLLIACSLRRAVLVPVDPDLHRDEISFILSDAAPVIMIANRPLSASSGAANRVVHSLDALILVANSGDSFGTDVSLSYDEASPLDVTLMIYTSGTTGTNKCVMLTGANLVANATSLRARYAIGPTDRFFCTLPTHHMNAIMMTGMVPFVSGASVVMSDILSFKSAKNYFKLVAAHDITICSLVPSIMALLLKLFPRGASAETKLRFGFCGAAPLSSHLWKEFEEVFRLPVHQGYGLTETTCWAVSSLPDGPRRYDSVGVPLDAEVTIDERELSDRESLLFAENSLASPKDLPVSDSGPSAGRSGEVLIRGPIVAAGYFKNPKLTRESRTSDGFFRTGDLGHFDATGHLHITGRIKEIIIKNGTNVFPEDIDRVLMEHPSVELSKTVGIRDELVGERICCAYVRRPGTAVTEPELRAWLTSKISQHMWPDLFAELGYLPAGPAGKITTNVLRKIVSGDLAEEMFTALSSWKYKRCQPDGPEQIRALLQSSLERGVPIQFLSFWGCGTRDSLGERDQMTLDRMVAYVDGVRRVPQAPPLITLVMTDTHARNNQIPEARLEGYFSAIEAAAESRGMQTIRMSRIWEDAGISVASVRATAHSQAWGMEWSHHPLRERLIAQAAKHCEGGNEPEEAARFYLSACQAEAAALHARYGESIFMTFNDPDFDALLPPLPKLYLYSYKEGTSVKPWFT